MNTSNNCIIAALIVLTLPLTGCFSSNKEDINAFLKPDQAEIAAQYYKLRPPDEIIIHCSSIPELHEQEQTVRPDGKIAFETLGEIEVSGKTPNEVAELIRQKASTLYALTGDYPIDVRVTKYKSAVFYIFGIVSFPGAKTFTGRDTVVSAVSRGRTAGGAWLQRVQVIRPSDNPDIPPKIFEVDLDKMLAHGDTSKNVLLQEGDMIYVPPTILAGIGMVVEELLRPIGRAFSTVNIVEGPNN